MHTQQGELSAGRFSADYQPTAFSKPRSRHGGTMKLRCPHCRAVAAVRTSKELTPVFRELRLQCTDLDCGATYVASVTIDRMIVSSQKPNPRIRLRQGHAPTPVAANDDVGGAPHEAV